MLYQPKTILYTTIAYILKNLPFSIIFKMNMYAEIQIQCIRTFLIINVLLSQTNNKITYNWYIHTGKLKQTTSSIQK